MSELAGQLSLADGMAMWQGYELLLPGETLRFYSGTSDSSQPVVWQGNTYTPWPIEATDFGTPGEGAPARPKLVVGNFGGVISALCREHEDLLGQRIRRRRTLVKYLDSVNFTEGNPSANPSEEYAPDTWVITRKVNETPASIEFELGSPLDLHGVMLPRRQIIAGTCMWSYRSVECGYTGGPVADYKNEPTVYPEKDQCSRTLTGCKLRFGENAELPFGGFPGAARLPRM